MSKRSITRVWRTISFLLVIILGTLSVFGGIATVICYELNMYSGTTKQDVLSQIYDRLQEHYEIQVIKNMDDPDFNQLKDTNFTYRLYEAEGGKTEEEMPAGHVYYADDAMWCGSTYGVLWHLLNHDYIISEGDNNVTETFGVDSLVYNPQNTVIYYQANNDCYPVREIEVDTKLGKLKKNRSATDSSSLIYYFTPDKNQYLCEDESYEPLDTSTYPQWVTAVLDGMEVYTHCIVSAHDPDHLTWHGTDYSLDSTYEEGDLGYNGLLYISNTESFTTHDVTTHDGLRTLVKVVPEISIEVKEDAPTQYIVSSEVASPLDMSKPDLFVSCTKVIDTLYPNRLLILYGTIIACGLLLAFIIICCRCTLRMKPDGEGGEDKPGLFARIPLFLYLCVTGGLLFFCIISFCYIFNQWKNASQQILNMDLTLLIEIVLIGFFLGIHILTNLCERIRTKTLLRYTVCYYLAKPFCRLWKMFRTRGKQMQDFWIAHTSLLLRTGLIWGVLSLLQLFVILATEYNAGTEVFLFILYKLIEAAFVLAIIAQFSRIIKGGKLLCEGDLSQKLDTTRLFGPFKRHAEHLNQIGDGIQIAVQERLKSEHFKTELITNVTHDIKTPLTSIINYVDLLQKEGITADEAENYLEVLDRQSARLKKLIEDLIEASKASTGNVSVIFEPCDLEILLTQTLGEFEEKLLANHLELIIRNTSAQTAAKADSNFDEVRDTALIIQADNRHLWRVFDNLMNNICKYAQPHTRVYIDLTEEGGVAGIIFRNTSRYPLKADEDALLERFVRGDTSRNTEGNGLGLSIAKSLTDLMGGTMKLYVDGDLFKVVITFPLKKGDGMGQND